MAKKRLSAIQSEWVDLVVFMAKSTPKSQTWDLTAQRADFLWGTMSPGEREVAVSTLSRKRVPNKR